MKGLSHRTTDINNASNRHTFTEFYPSGTEENVLNVQYP
jgi:hypothetical protein